MFDARPLSGPYLAWTTLAYSRLRQRVLRLATLASLVIAGALVAAAIPDARAVVFATAALALLAAGAAWRQSACAARPIQLAIDARGEIRVRAGESGADEALRPIYVSNWQIVLDSQAGPLAVWSDALNEVAFRRLVVFSRWRMDRSARPRTNGQDGEEGHRQVGRRGAPAQGEAAN